MLGQASPKFTRLRRARIKIAEMVRQAHHPEQGRRTNPNCRNFNDQNKSPKMAYASGNIGSPYNEADKHILVEKTSVMKDGEGIEKR